MGGIPGGYLDKVVQTGVFVCSPKHHKEKFEYIYYNYEDPYKNPSWNYEMPAMSYELLKNELVEWIPAQFNFCVLDLTAAFYPFIFQNPPKSFIEKAVAKIHEKSGFVDSKTFLKIQCLKNIYDLGYFIHFAGCRSMMKDLYQFL